MALIKCRKCGEAVSTRSAACFNCGARIRRRRPLLRIALAALVLFGLLIVLVARYFPSSLETMNECARSMRAPISLRVQGQAAKAEEAEREVLACVQRLITV